jgi:hypothetical protein
MIRNLLFVFCLIFVFSFSTYSNGINIKLEIPIIKNGPSVTDTLDNGQIVTYDVSSDDAEQENDAMDKLYDDDLDAGWEGAPEDQNIMVIGLRFQNISIPKGATIDSAFISGYSHENKSTSDLAKITIAGELSGFPETFNLDALITDRPKTNSKLLWTVAEDWEMWQPVRTPDIKDIIQEIISQESWSTGNPVSLFLMGENQGPSEDENTREFESFENISDPEEGGDGQNHPERVPRLVIYYTNSNAVLIQPIIKNGDSVTDTLDNGQIVTYDVSSDDAEQENDEMDKLYDDDLDAGWEGAPEDQNIMVIGLRFQNISIPKGSTIDSAFISGYSHENKSTSDLAKITIAGELSGFPETFNLDELITDRPKTNSKLLWTVAEDWEMWQPVRTPDIKDIIQEIISQESWSAGNPVSIFLMGENQGPSEDENTREFESFENISDPEEGGDGQNHPERAPKLIVYFSSKPSPVAEDISIANNIEVYPNPVTDGNISIRGINLTGSDVLIYNQLGQTLKSYNSLNTDDFNADLSSLPDGPLYIRIIKDGKSQQITLIKN